MSAAVVTITMKCFPLAYLNKANQVFLCPRSRYSWEEIVLGIPVRSASGGTRRMSAVGQNTFRAFRRVSKNCPGAKKEFSNYFVEERASLADALSALHNRVGMHRLSNRICDGIRARLINISPPQLRAYNKIRKPVDLYLEHLVAMAVELDRVRETLIPLLFLPLDSQILAHPGLFTDEDLATHNLSRSSTYKDITSERTYSDMQKLLVKKAEAVAAKRRRPFYPIYFDLLWNHRYRNWGGNLFETNP